jgi:hypothetical protein
MRKPVALRERGRLAALLDQVWHDARRRWGRREPDRRNARTWRQLLLGVMVGRSTRLVTLGRVLLGQRAAGSAKAAAVGLGAFLAQARFAARPESTRLLEAAVRRLDPARLATYGGRAVVAIDPTDYPKRSRGRGRRGRQMQHVGRVRKPTRGGHRAGGRGATTSGYVDVWAGLVLKGKQFLPLARHLFSSAHPTVLSQNRVEEAVLFQALALLARVGLPALVVGDRGLGRKELLVKLAARGQAFVLRLDPDVTAHTPAVPAGQPLAALLARQPWLGEVVWDRGQEGPLPCRARAVPAAGRFSRTGRQADYQEATLHFLELVPLVGPTDPLVLATTLPLGTVAAATGVARVYSWRWSIETAFEAMKAWGLGRFMVRSWQGIDRLLWVVALAYALLVLALREGPLAVLREQATALLRCLAVLGRRLTAGKLAEAIGLDYHRHHRAWAAVWHT